MNTPHTKLTGHSGNDEMRTPPDLFKWLDRRFRFDYDAAASHENHLTDRYSTVTGTWITEAGASGSARYATEDGLALSWEGLRVYCNPPYSRGLLTSFVQKAIDERNSAEIIVLLTKCDTSTFWWQLLNEYGDVKFIPYRLKYLDADGQAVGDAKGRAVGASFASCITIIRPDWP